MFTRLKGLYRERQWAKQRAKGILPECDCWNFKDTLVDHIQQGIQYLLREDGWIDYTADTTHKQMKKDLEFILKWTKEYQYMAENDLEVIAADRAEGTHRWDDYQKMQTEAFKLLDKWLCGLWD